MGVERNADQMVSCCYLNGNQRVHFHPSGEEAYLSVVGTWCAAPSPGYMMHLLS